MHVESGNETNDVYAQFSVDGMSIFSKRNLFLIFCQISDIFTIATSLCSEVCSFALSTGWAYISRTVSIWPSAEESY